MKEAIQKHNDNTLVNRNELHFPGEKEGTKTKVKMVMIDGCFLLESVFSCFS